MGATKEKKRRNRTAEDDLGIALNRLRHSRADDLYDCSSGIINTYALKVVIYGGCIIIYRT